MISGTIITPPSAFNSPRAAVSRPPRGFPMLTADR